MSVVLAAALAFACGGGAAAPGDGSGGAPAGGSGGAAALGAGGTLGTGGASSGSGGGGGDTFACVGPGGTYTETNTLVSAGNCQGLDATRTLTVMASAAPTACHPLPIQVGACVTTYAYDSTVDAQGTCASLTGTITWNAAGTHGEGDVTMAIDCGAVVYHVTYDRP